MQGENQNAIIGFMYRLPGNLLDYAVSLRQKQTSALIEAEAIIAVHLPVLQNGGSSIDG
jgi:hypothetical protein